MPSKTQNEVQEHLIEDELDPVPLVIVEGFLGGKGPARWGKFEDYLNMNTGNMKRRRIIYASVGPVSSLHDRACELYYMLRGGTVDYGEQHAREHDHGQYGRTHAEGEYPHWSKDKPLHFLSHSLGGPTVTKLQWLIQTGFFGKDLHPDMILSINSVSAPYRGSPGTYVAGQRVNTGLGQRPFTFGHSVHLIFETLSYLQPIASQIVDTHSESRGLTYHETSLWSLLRKLWQSDWADGRDHGPYDVGFHSADTREFNGEGKVNPGTFYRSYSASITRKVQSSLHHTPSSWAHLTVPYFYWLSYHIGRFDYFQVQPLPKILDVAFRDMHGTVDSSPKAHKEWVHSAAMDGYTHPDETLYANDGLIPVFSQWHPFDCNSTKCKHLGESQCSKPSQGDGPDYHDIEPGVWHVYHLDEANHCSLVPIWVGSSRQKAFFTDLGRWLGAVDITNSKRRKIEERIHIDS